MPETDYEDQLEGSTSGSHDRIEHLLRAGPATAAQKNTFRPAIYPIACWRIDDLRFEFDSSFVRPQARKEFRKLKVIVDKNPEAPLSVFGHADPSGSDDYNKRLSGRRAQAIYGALIRDAALWEALYSDPFLGDDWGNASLVTMLEALGYTGPDGLKSFLGSRGMAPAGPNSRAARLALFEAYMDWLCGDLKLDKSRFLARGADAKGKGDYQGCSEFNPILLFSKDENKELEKDKPKRNQENAPNRRVMVFLFRPKSYVNPGKWPCPRASEGMAGCKKRWWSDGEQRRSFQAVRRRYEETHDTFACRFYDRMASNSPCEGGQVVPLTKLRVYLRLLYLDPEKKERPFPPEMPVIVKYDGGDQQETIGQDGLLSFEFDRAKDRFTLVFEHTKAYVASAAPDCTKDPKERYIFEPEVPQVHQDRYFVFRLPKKWSLQESDWPTVEAGSYNRKTARFEGLSAFTATVGAAGAPSRMVLDPHWLYLRYEFFDRYYGHSDHGEKRVGVPPILVDGMRENPNTRGAIDDPDTQSNWWLNEADPQKSCQALPWILQEKTQPTAKCLLQLRNASHTFVISSDATTRKVETVTDDARLKASADRLKLYDLPRLWKSANYYTRGVNKFFDELTDAEVQGSSIGKPHTFCLDDIVFTDHALHQVSLGANDRVAIFYNGFDKNGPGKLSNTGVYEYDDGAKKSYFSKVDQPRRYYLAQYADWTRLVIAQGNLWDVFLARTPDEDPNQVVGARAALRWVDHSTLFTAGDEIAARPARVDRPSGPSGVFFSIQPYAYQYYAPKGRRYDGTGDRIIGRNDQALLRCCGRDEDNNELFVNLHYFRYHFTWNPAQIPNTHPPATSNFAPPTPANQGARDEFVEKLVTGVADRWNGDDVHNIDRGALLPQDSAKKLQGQVVFFLQPADDTAHGHYTIDIVRVGPGDRVARMNAVRGTGRLGDSENVTQGDGWFTIAHESGHGDALPDEYNERWNNFSYEALSIDGLLPGDPFEPDDGDPNGAMMNVNRRVRNRHLWHAAEFSRSVTGAAYKMKHGSYDAYLVPPHTGFPERTHAYWPINHDVNAAPGGRAQYDLLLYTAGPDRYTVDILPSGPYDGILVIQVRMLFTFWLNNAAQLTSLVAKLSSAIDSEFNHKWCCIGKVRDGTPQAWEFKKCLLQFSPRFIVSNNNTGNANYNALINGIGTHFTVAVNRTDPNPPNSRWAAASPGRDAILECSGAVAAARDVQLEDAFKAKFCGMLGLAENPAAVTAAALLPMVRRVVTTNAAVAAI